MSTYCEELTDHYVAVWNNRPTPMRWGKGPVWELPSGFSVLEFPPTDPAPNWTYATRCMSQPSDSALLELHLFSPIQSESHVELLTIVAHYHRTGAALGLGHTVNFGRPWIDGSSCEYGLISLPYLDGPALEQYRDPSIDRVVSFFWLIPITQREREYKMERGLEALEQRFEASGFDYLDPRRPSVV